MHLVDRMELVIFRTSIIYQDYQDLAGPQQLIFMYLATLEMDDWVEAEQMVVLEEIVLEITIIVKGINKKITTPGHLCC